MNISCILFRRSFLISALATGIAVTGTAGVSPASSNGFTLFPSETINSNKVASHEDGRDARDPSSRGFVLLAH